MKLKKTIFPLIATLTLFPLMAQSGEYKIILQQVIDIKGAGDWVDAEPDYTTWETIDGTRSCKSWAPVIDEQTSDFEQSRDCTVEQTRDKTTREYNTTLDEYRDISTTEQQRDYTLPAPETRLINVATSSWSDSGSTYECSNWTPDTDTAFENETVEQSRECKQDEQRTVDYTYDSEVLDTFTQIETTTVNETQTVSGTKTMYASCKAINDNGADNGDGVYTIFPNNNDGVEVYCDMTTDGGGWTVAMGNNSPENLLTLNNWKNSNGYSIDNNASITINKVQCTDTTITGGAVLSDVKHNISYSEVRFSLNWQGYGSGDTCKNDGQMDGVGLNGGIVTNSPTVSRTTSQLSNITLSCECLDNNKQGGTTQGTVMVR